MLMSTPVTRSHPNRLHCAPRVYVFRRSVIAHGATEEYQRFGSARPSLLLPVPTDSHAAIFMWMKHWPVETKQRLTTMFVGTAELFEVLFQDP